MFLCSCYLLEQAEIFQDDENKFILTITSLKLKWQSVCKGYFSEGTIKIHSCYYNSRNNEFFFFIL